MSVGGGPISGLGKVSLWGHSPAIDFMPFIRESLKTGAEDNTIRILLIGQADLRHVLETFAKNSCFLENENILIQFYLAEDFPEVIGRQMLLLLLATQSSSEIGLQEKRLQWLEIFGNTLMRPKTRKTFLELCDKLIDLMNTTNEANIFDLNDLKFRERDDLVEIFNHWKSCGDIFPIQDHWTKRLEKHLGIRYDVRQNVFDWDYNMRLVDNGASVVTAAEYKKWRGTGIAFADFDSEYSQPNVSLATGIATGGGAFLAYRGEIVTGPFISFGIEAEDASLFETANGKHKSTSYDVSLHNLQRIFSAIDATEKALRSTLRVTLLSPSMFGGPRFFANYPTAFFDAIFMSTSSAQYLIPPIINLLKPGAPIVVEDTRYLLELRTEQKSLYKEKVLELAAKCKLELVDSAHQNSAFLHFIKPSAESSVGVTNNEADAGDILRTAKDTENTASSIPPEVPVDTHAAGSTKVVKNCESTPSDNDLGNEIL